MRNRIIALGIALIFVLLTGGCLAFFQGTNATSVGFFAAFPTLMEDTAQDFLSSPYTWTGMVMFILSVFGIWVGKRKGKLLHAFISGIISIISLIVLIIGIKHP